MVADVYEASKAHTAICMLTAVCQLLETATSDGEIKSLDVDGMTAALKDEIQHQLERYEAASGS